MATYTFELGVDGNAATQWNTTYCYLPWGLVDESPSAQRIVSTMSPGLANADSLNFEIFDITSGGSAGFQSPTLTVNIAQADASGPQPPLSQVTVTNFALTPNLLSLYFGSVNAGWTSSFSLGLGNFPQGHYLLTFTVNATNANGPKTFKVDPEMVVGADGQVGPGEDPALPIPAPQSSVVAGASPTSSL